MEQKIAGVKKQQEDRNRENGEQENAIWFCWMLKADSWK
jgi:hypothetical protein